MLTTDMTIEDRFDSLKGLDLIPVSAMDTMILTVDSWDSMKYDVPELAFVSTDWASVLGTPESSSVAPPVIIDIDRTLELMLR